MTHQKFEGERTLMRIHIGESDKWHGEPLYETIVELLRKEQFSGVTVLRGVAGYGSSSVYHTDKLLRLSQDLPIILEVKRLASIAAGVEELLPQRERARDVVGHADRSENGQQEVQPSGGFNFHGNSVQSSEQPCSSSYAFYARSQISYAGL